MPRSSGEAEQGLTSAHSPGRASLGCAGADVAPALCHPGRALATNGREGRSCWVAGKRGKRGKRSKRCEMRQKPRQCQEGPPASEPAEVGHGDRRSLAPEGKTVTNHPTQPQM